jgi:hypothetical protein
MVEQQAHRLDQQIVGCRALLDGEHLELPPRLGFQPQGLAPARAIVSAGGSFALAEGAWDYIERLARRLAKAPASCQVTGAV